MPIRKRRTANRFFDVAAPHKKARRPFAYHIPLLAKLHLYGPHRKKKQAAVLGGSLAFLLLLVLVFQVESLFANLKTLHPATCSGDWQDAAMLTGEPELGEVGARATEAGQKIFCSFAIPKLKEPVPLTRAVLALSFKGESPTPVIEEPVPESSGGEEQATTTEEVPAEETVEEAPVPVEEPLPEEVPVVEEAPIEEPTPEPEVEEAPVEEAPVSFWQRLFATSVHAQEEVPAEEPAPEPVAEEPTIEEVALPEETPVVEEVLVEEPVPEPQEEASVEESVTEEVLSGSTPDEPETKLTISYTLDGVLWTDITTFAPRDNEVTFDLDIVSSDQVEKLVVRVTADEVAGEPVYLRAAELRIWTEAPLDDLLAPILQEETPGIHVFDRDFEIDPDATHFCIFDPLTVDLSSGTSTTFMLQLQKGDDLGQGVSGLIAHVSEAVLEVITEELPPEPLATTTEETLTEESVQEETDPEETASSTEEAVPKERASSTEEVLPEELVVEEEQGIIEEIVDSGVEVLEELARIRVGMLEIGSLPVGIDIRFIGEAPYSVELFDDSPDTFSLSASVFAPEGAQEGSFSVPLIFTRTDGKESTVVCQINVLNRPGSVPVVAPEETTLEPEMREEPAGAVESAEAPGL